VTLEVTSLSAENRIMCVGGVSRSPFGKGGTGEQTEPQPQLRGKFDTYRNYTAHGRESWFAALERMLKPVVMTDAPMGSN